jgi:hypothetical protein
LNTRGDEIDRKFAAATNAWNGTRSEAHDCEYTLPVVPCCTLCLLPPFPIELSSILLLQSCPG